MSAINPPKKISKHQELRQDTVVTFYARAWGYFDQHRNLVYGVLGALLAVVLVAVGYTLYQSNQQDKAQKLLGAIVSVYERGDYKAALDGTEGKPGLLAIADDYSGTDAGNLAHFYAGDALFRLGQNDNALEHFQAYDKEDDLVGASAIAAEAAIYEDKGDPARAAGLYQEAATTFDNELTSPQYLLNAGQAYEKAGKYDEAREIYESISTKYPESSLAEGIDFYLARLNAREATPAS